MNPARFPAKLKPDSLGLALLGAAQAAAQVRTGTALPQALAQAFERLDATPQARGAMQDIAYRTMRHLGTTDALIGKLTDKRPEPPLLHSLLNCALTLMVPGAADYEAFTVVDQTVTAAAADRRIAHAKGMVNAVLRRYLREKDTLDQVLASDPTAAWNYPGWWIDANRSAYPLEWEAILHAGNLPPPMTLRVNRLKSSVENYLSRLGAEGMPATQVGPYAVRLARPVPVDRIPGFAEGIASVQDAAAQLAAPLLDPQPGMRVLDACAAPGGKTGHLLEWADVSLTALDQDPLRLKRVAQNLQRLSLQATLKTGDAAAADWWDGQAFDCILADVPCTASGIVRRHPDIRWLRRPDDAARLSQLAGRILDNLWTMLRPDGKLLFVTCSVWPEESARQADNFSLRQVMSRLPAPGQLLPVANEHEDHDGLFYALFQKPPF